MADGKYWNEKIETMPTEEIKKLQLQKLKNKSNTAIENSGFYRKKFDRIGLNPKIFVHLMIYKKFLLQLKVI